MSAPEQTETAIGRWHDVVNHADLDAARLAVNDPVVVNGPKGAGPITPDDFADWITRSGIRMRPRSWHPISERVMVVEQDARWPQDQEWSRVATVFRATGNRISAALRFPDLRTALEFAHIYTELAATEKVAPVTQNNPEPQGAGQTLFQLVRHWSRRWHTTTDSNETERARDVLVTEAVHALQAHGQVTVNDVAAELAIDQSGASRMLTHAVEQGLLTISKSSTDARRRIITLTCAGHDFLTSAHQWQDAMFATLTSDWTPQERSEFHRAISRLLDRSADLTHKR